MFFLKELPTTSMIQGYANQYPMENIDSVEAALLMMRQASLLVRRLEGYFSQHNISQLRFLILIVIDREPDRQSLLASEISARIDVSRPVMTRTLQSLQNDNLISIKADEDDGRARQIFLTDKGRCLLEKILPGYFELIGKFMQELRP